MDDQQITVQTLIARSIPVTRSITINYSGAQLPLASDLLTFTGTYQFKKLTRIVGVSFGAQILNDTIAPLLSSPADNLGAFFTSIVPVSTGFQLSTVETALPLPTSQGADSTFVCWDATRNSFQFWIAEVSEFQFSATIRDARLTAPVPTLIRILLSITFHQIS